MAVRMHVIKTGCCQEVPLGYLGPFSALATPVNSWDTLT